MIPGFPAAYAWLFSAGSAALDQCGLNLSAGCAANARLLISLTKIMYDAEIMDPPSKAARFALLDSGVSHLVRYVYQAADVADLHSRIGG